MGSSTTGGPLVVVDVALVVGVPSPPGAAELTTGGKGVTPPEEKVRRAFRYEARTSGFIAARPSAGFGAGGGGGGGGAVPVMLKAWSSVDKGFADASAGGGFDSDVTACAKASIAFCSAERSAEGGGGGGGGAGDPKRDSSGRGSVDGGGGC